MYSTINKIKDVTGGSLDVDQVAKDVFGMKICNASVQIINGNKSNAAYKANGLNKNLIKTYTNFDSLYYNVAKGNKEYKPAKRPNPNKGKKLIRNGNGDVQYVDKIVYDELVESGKLKKAKPEASKKKKQSKIRGGALMNGCDVELFGGSARNIETNATPIVKKAGRPSDEFRNM